jgi:hypothetical protein
MFAVQKQVKMIIQRYQFEIYLGHSVVRKKDA